MDKPRITIIEIDEHFKSVDKFIEKYSGKIIGNLYQIPKEEKVRTEELTAFLDQEVREPVWVVRPLPERINWEEVKAHIPDWYDAEGVKLGSQFKNAVGVAVVNSLKDTPGVVYTDDISVAKELYEAGREVTLKPQGEKEEITFYNGVLTIGEEARDLEELKLEAILENANNVYREEDGFE